ncbi:MAG: efflux RND transporter periplasmic adaptor subunit [Chitinophagales bacterium]|nr:efflux RND transporter periplasmic adaptor subunit [Chitinophagales bacterium]
MKTSHKTAIILSSIVFITIAGCKNKKNTAEDTPAATAENIVQLTAEQIKYADITVGSMQQQDISGMLTVNGKIDVPPQNTVSISVPLGGYLKNTQLLTGMHVSKGQVIATMEDPQYIELQENYLTTKAKLKVTELEYQRQKELNQNKVSSDKIFQQTEAEYTALQIQLKALSEKLLLIGINPAQVTIGTISKSISVKAPINGYVSAVHANIGKYAAPGDVLFELIDPSDIHLSLTVFEKDIDRVKIGQKVMAYTNNHPEKKYASRIILTARNLGDNRDAEIHCHFDKYDPVLMPGMYMNADIETTHSNAYTLPDDAIVRLENKQFIFIQQKDGQYVMTEVQTGISDNGITEILNGDSLKDATVVTHNAYTLLMKLKNKSEE